MKVRAELEFDRLMSSFSPNRLPSEGRAEDLPGINELLALSRVVDVG